MLYTNHHFTDAQLLDIISNSITATAIYTGDDVIINAVNERMLDFWGRDESVIGKPLAEALPELINQPFIGILQNVWRIGETYEAKSVPADIVVDGRLQTFYFDFIYKALKNADGSTYCVLHTSNDVTAEVKAKQAVQSNEQRFHSLMNHSPVAMGMLSGSDLIIEMANLPLLNIWYKSAEEVIGKPLLKAFSNPYQQSYPEHLKKVLLTGKAYNNPEEILWIQGPNGPLKSVLNLTYTPITDTKGQVTSILLTGIDITDQVHYRQTMNHAQEQFKLAIESAELGTWNFDAATRSFQPSGRFKELYGYYNYEEMPDNAAISQITAEYREKVITAINAAFDGNEDFKIDYPIVRAHSNEISWMQANGKLYRDGNGKPEHLSGIILDITDQKQQIAQQNDFIAMASHELKTPVTSIKGLAQVIELMLRKEGNFKMADMALKLQNQVGRLITLIGDLLDITKLQAGKLQFDESWFDFNTVVADTIDEMQRTTDKHDIFSNLNFHGQIFGDKERIRQVIINFISNAIKYSPEADTIIVNTTVNSGYVELYVKDFGIGIDRRHLKKVFDQFYRVTGSSEKKFKGLGLGLYISSTIIQRSGGKIWADSEVGSGSTFCFSLPVDQQVII